MSKEEEVGNSGVRVSRVLWVVIRILDFVFVRWEVIGGF